MSVRQQSTLRLDVGRWVGVGFTGETVDTCRVTSSLRCSAAVSDSACVGLGLDAMRG